MNNIATTLILMLISFGALSQEDHWADQFLEKTKGVKIISWEKPTNDGEIWQVIVKVKKKIGIYLVSISAEIDMDGNDSTYIDDIDVVIRPQYDNIHQFTKIDKEDSDLSDALQGETVEVAEVLLKKKTGIIIRHGDEYDFSYLSTAAFFQEIDWKHSKGTYVPVVSDSKWGIYDWYEQKYLFKCEYGSFEELPKTADASGFNSYSIEIFTAFNKQSKWDAMDKIDMDGNNGDGLFKARSAESKKWGLYQYLGDNIIEAIPMKYDSVYHFPWNGNYTAVFNAGKVGFFLSYWTYDEDAKQTVPCIYEDYKRYITDDQTPKLAVKKNGKWGWIDWLTGEEKSEFKYETTDDLPYPYYKQEIWFED